jgi:hypothetical protein
MVPPGQPGQCLLEPGNLFAQSGIGYARLGEIAYFRQVLEAQRRVRGAPAAQTSRRPLERVRRRAE